MLTTAIVDLETSDLTADKGVLLVACIKSSRWKGIKTIRIDEEDGMKWKAGMRGTDINTCRATADALQDHDVIVAHNGQWFDIPFLRTRMLKWNLPRLPDTKIVDPCQVLRRKFRMGRNSLASIVDHLNLRDKKTSLDLSVWMDAMLNGSISALDLIAKHCVADVKALEGVFNVVKPYIKVLDDKGSAL